MEQATFDNESKEEEEPILESKLTQGSGIERPTKEHVVHILRSLSSEQLVDLLVPYVQNDAMVYSNLVREAESDIHRRKLFVHGVPARTTEDQFKSFFQTFGEVELVELPHAKVHSEVKFGFVVFTKLSALQAALAQPNKFFEGKEICCKAFAVRSPPSTEHSPLASQAFPGAGGQPRKVFVSGLSPSVTERELAEYFRVFGDIELAQVMPGKTTGFVQFVESSAAQQAIHRLNRSTWMGRQLTVAWFQKKQDDGRMERRASLQSMSSVTSATSYSNQPPPMTPSFSAATPNWFGYPYPMQQENPPFVLYPVFHNNEYPEYPPEIFPDSTRGRV